MFCPNCGLEYRPGFTRCNDCEVDLVETLPGEGEAEEAEGEELLEPRLLWRGTQGAVFTEIGLGLDEAKIRYNRENLDARMTFSGDHPLELWVPEADLSAAEKVRDEVLQAIRLAAEQEAMRTAAMASVEHEEYDDGSGLPEEGFVEEPHPEDATAEVWSGEDESLAVFLKSALATNGIGCLLEDVDGKRLAIRVAPELEERAGGIVRQVVEGISPE